MKIYLLLMIVILNIGIANAAVTDGLLGYWSMDEASGTNVANSVSGGVNGTATATYPAVTTDGFKGNARYATGVDSKWITLNNAICNLGTGDFAVSFAFKYNFTANQADNFAIIGNQKSSPPYNGWFIDIPGTADSTNKGRLRTFYVPPSGSVYGEYNSPQYMWNYSTNYTFGVIMRNASHVYISINNGTIQEMNIANARDNPLVNITNTVTNCVLMGNGDNAGYSFGGHVDEIGLWNRTLTQSEISSVYSYAYPFTAPAPPAGCTGSSNCTHQCGTNFTTSVNMNGNTLAFNGTGTTYINANISNAKITLPQATACKIILNTGKIY